MLREHRTYLNMEVLKTLEHLNETEHLGLEIKEIKSTDRNIDLVIELNEEKIFIEDKYEIRPNQINQIYQQAELYHEEIFLVASNYITPSAKELLKQRRINYLDSGGNIYLKLKKGLIHIEGKYVKSPSEKYRNRAFTKVGAKLIFTFLKNPSYVTLNYRSLTAISTCSLGSITKIIDHLKEEKFIITLPDGKLKLVQKDKLLNKWVEVLRTQLLPSMNIGKYDFVKNTKWYELDLKNETGYKWGGEVAASILTKNLKPEKYSIYTLKNETELIRKLKLVPNRNGPISIYKQFWNDEPHGEIVNPVLIYAELMSTSDSRNIEVANEIKEKYFNDQF